MDEVNYNQAVAEFERMFELSKSAEEAGEESPDGVTSGAETSEQTGSTNTEDTHEDSGSADNSQAGQSNSANQNSQGSKEEKQNQAFARMRTENASMQKTLNLLAQALGVDPKGKSHEDVSADLQNRLTAVLAKQQGIDPKVLERLNHLEDINARYEQAQNEKKIYDGLQAIKDKYAATDDDLNSYVVELANDNFDISKGDIEIEFVRRNFQKILDNKINAAVKAEQERAAKGNGASQPSTKKGQDDNSEPYEINTMADFERALAEAAGK